MPDPIYVWDIDRTIVRSSLERHFIAYLRERVPRFSLLRTAFHVLKLAVRFPVPPTWQFKLAYLRGCGVNEVDYWIEDCFSSRIVPAIYSGSLTAIRKLSVEKKTQLLVSGTPRPLAAKLADHLGLANVIAAEPEIVDNRYTGRLLQPHPREKYKVSYVQEWLDKNNQAWEKVVALADHIDDQYLLGRAGGAIAVNPDTSLAALAKQQGWTIVADAARPDSIVSVL